jgi:hypothetical protein
VRGLLIVVLAAVAWAQQATPIFPDDNEKPKEGGAAELLEAVCPGKVVTGRQMTCGDVCPEFTGFRGDQLDWRVVSVIRGHFLSPTSDDLALAVLGCEAHNMNFGGTVVLTRHSKKWRMLWYKPGVQTEQCHKVPLADGREILVCIGQYGGQGSISTSLYVQDLLSPTENLMAEERQAAFFEVVDDTATCGWNMEDDAKPNPLTLQYIERVTFGVQRKNKTVLSVTARCGERSMTPADVLAMPRKWVDELQPANQTLRGRLSLRRS